jgi:hypothetical protein
LFIVVFRRQIGRVDVLVRQLFPTFSRGRDLGSPGSVATVFVERTFGDVRQ